MKIGAMYSHLNGFEWIQYHQKKMWQEIEGVIKSVDVNRFRTKISKEKTMKGKKMFSPVEINKKLKQEFEKLNWFEGRTAIYSYNQTDFVKNRVAIEIQFGKYSFIAYDLFVKHLAFYVGYAIDVGIEILPMKSMQAEMSSGPGYYEGALYDLARQGRGVPAVPLVLVGIEP